MVIERQFSANLGNDWCDIHVGGVVVRLLDDPIPRQVHEKRFQYGECYLAEHPKKFAIICGISFLMNQCPMFD